MGTIHQPVLLDEVLAWLAPREGSVLLDGTAGGGGHAAALAARVGSTGRVIGLDRDPAMLDLARGAVGGLPVTLVHAPYAEMARVLEELGIDRVHGVLLDLGLSSDQLAWEGRGFSFAADGPLDMRFDPESGGPTAADLVNRLSAEELANLFYEFGEERFSRRIARRIVEARQKGPIRTTGELAELVRRSIPGPAAGPIDPATRVFQALRIAVNDELGQLDAALRVIPDVLAPGGRAAIISFHSLEDRRVKWAFRSDPRLTVLTKKPVTATARRSGRQPPGAQRQTKGGRAMSELISNPQPESAPRLTGPSGHVAYDGLDGLHHPGIVVRYDAVSDPPDDPTTPRTRNPVDVRGRGSTPGTESAGRIRAILDVLGQGLLALSWACLRTAYRYPRWALVIVLSVVILGATALTRPGKPTLTAAIPPEKPAASPAGSGEPKAPEEGKKEPKPDQTALAKADPAPATETKDGKKDDPEAGRGHGPGTPTRHGHRGGPEGR